MCLYQPMEAVNRRQLKTNGDELTVLEGIQNFLPMSVFLLTFFSFSFLLDIYRSLISKDKETCLGLCSSNFPHLKCSMQKAALFLLQMTSFKVLQM